MEETYDQFNLMIKPDHAAHVQLNFNPSSHKRRAAKGIIPLPNKKRVVLQHDQKLASEQITHHDRFVQFEANPLEYMIEKEFEHGKTLKALTPEVSMICNLQNIKHCLKSDFSDQQILDSVLLNMNFIDNLIESHLNQQDQTSEEPCFL